MSEKKKKELKKTLTKKGKLNEKYFEQELLKLQEELVKLQYWVKEKGLRVVVIFEGRDAAGKGSSHLPRQGPTIFGESQDCDITPGSRWRIRAEPCPG